jgi:hypothetical protein
LRLMGNEVDAKFAWFEGQTASMHCDMGSLTDCHSREFEESIWPWLENRRYGFPPSRE